MSLHKYRLNHMQWFSSPLIRTITNSSDSLKTEFGHFFLGLLFTSLLFFILVFLPKVSMRLFLLLRFDHSSIRDHIYLNDTLNFQIYGCLSVRWLSCFCINGDKLLIDENHLPKIFVYALGMQMKMHVHPIHPLVDYSHYFMRLCQNITSTWMSN